MSGIVGRLRSYARNLGGAPEDYLTWQAADEIERLRMALRSAPCPSSGWNGMPDIEPTVAACMDHGVCGCDLGRALEGK